MKNKTFREILKEHLISESPIGSEGDFKGNKVVMGNISTTVIKKYWKELTPEFSKKLTDRKGIKVFFIDNKKRAIIGRFIEDDNTFQVISELYLSTFKDIDKFGYKNVLQTSEVGTVKEYRGDEFVTSLYLTLIKSGVTLISDYYQYDGARRLWKGLQGYRIKLDIFDDIEDIVTKEHKIIHTDFDSMDKEWSKDPNSSGIRYLFIAFM